MTRVVAIIPARGGSKAIARKNLAPAGGRTLLAWTAAAALGSRHVDAAVLTTDDEEIAAAGRGLGLQVPYLRPPALATDETPMIDVLQHAVGELDRTGAAVDLVVLLQPTSPLRTSVHVDAAVDRYRAGGAGCVVTVVEIPHQYRPASALIERDGALVPYEPVPSVLRRQDKPVAYARNGPAVLVVPAAAVRGATLYPAPVIGFRMSLHDSWDVDEPDDLDLVDWLLRRRKQP